MSNLCRRCGNKMPKDRKGADQICPKCIDQIKYKTIDEKIADVLAKNLPVNYDGTQPGNYHILLKVSKAIKKLIKDKCLQYDNEYNSYPESAYEGKAIYEFITNENFDIDEWAELFD